MKVGNNQSFTLASEMRGGNPPLSRNSQRFLALFAAPVVWVNANAVAVASYRNSLRIRAVLPSFREPANRQIRTPQNGDGSDFAAPIFPIILT
jgi:hypothetical protein